MLMLFKTFSRYPRPHTREKPSSWVRATLLCYGMFDEIITGLPIVGLPLLRDYLGLSYEQIGLLFTVGSGSALLLEPLINILSDRQAKRFWVLGGLLVLVLSYLLAGSAPNYVLLLVSFALFFPATGVAVGLAQAVLIDSDPAGSIATMTRWEILASIGDVLAPLLVTVLTGFHQGWPTVGWLAAGLWAIVFLVTIVQRFPPRNTTTDKQADDDEIDSSEGEQEESTWRALIKALRNPLFLRWGVLTLLPTMVDEVFLGFVTLYLHDILHASEATIGLLLTVDLLSSLLGLVLLDRVSWLRRATTRVPRRLLAGLALLVLVGVIVLLSTRAIWLAGLALCTISLGAAGWYPIAQGQAYAQLPGRSGLVRALTGLGGPFEIMLPAVVGLLAARFGLLAGLALLGSAPLLLLFALIRYPQAARQ